MKTFRVKLRRTTVECATVIVLAKDEAEAERVAEARGGNGSGCAVDVIDVEPVD